jgi:hypothetical protein
MLVAFYSGIPRAGLSCATASRLNDRVSLEMAINPPRYVRFYRRASFSASISCRQQSQS